MSARFSIKSTCGQQFSTDFNKGWNLFWEQRVVSSNLTAPTNVFNALPINVLRHLLLA
jgi:hypothetical protein